MRKITSSPFISLDGVTEAPDKWQFDVFDEDMGNAVGKAFSTIDTMLLGRKTYEEWSQYWPTFPEGKPDSELAKFFNTAPKYVVSNTLDSVSWGSYDTIELIKGKDLAAKLAELKSQPGGDISVAGSPTLVASLVREGLLDRLTLLIHPVIVADGKRRLFQDGDGLKRMKLVDHSVTGSGVVILTYEPRRE